MNSLEQIVTPEQMEIQKLLNPAERYYANHLRNVSRYQKTHPEKMREKCNKYNAMLRQDPVKHEESKAKKGIIIMKLSNQKK